MRKTSVLIVLIKNTNVRYSIHLGSPSANGFPGLVCRGSHVCRWGEMCDCVGRGRISACVL